jgi:hypothetical protein
MNEKHPAAIPKLILTDAPHYRDFRFYALCRFPFAFEVQSPGRISKTAVIL